jgi:hypothetical protein
MPWKGRRAVYNIRDGSWVFNARSQTRGVWTEEALRSYLLEEFKAGFTEIVFRDPVTGREKTLDRQTLLAWHGLA